MRDIRYLRRVRQTMTTKTRQYVEVTHEELDRSIELEAELQGVRVTHGELKCIASYIRIPRNPSNASCQG